jgi:hypothetical protein
VNGTPEAPQCTCPDFQVHNQDPEWRCKHIIAVFNLPPKEIAADPYDAEERKAIQEESKEPEPKAKKAKANGTSQMVLKRSVSPDGRIDSLSVEFMLPVGKGAAEEIKERAAEAMQLQSEIVAGFLTNNGKEKNGRETAAVRSQPAKSEQKRSDSDDGSVFAQIVSIGGMNTQKGWRLFMNFNVNGRNCKLFGTRKELAQHVVDAGFTNLVNRIEDGMIFNLPCRVITRPSADGRFLNIERVLPVEALRSNGGE